MTKQCANWHQSVDDHQNCANCRYAAGTCQLDALNPCQACKGWSQKVWGKLRKSLQDCKPCNVPLDNYLPQLHTWLEGLSTSSDFKSEVSSIKDSEILDLDINCVNNFDNVVLLNKKHK